MLKKKLTAGKNLNFEKIGLNRASPQPDRAGIGLDFFSPIGLAKIGLSPIRAECFRAGPGGPNADPWSKPEMAGGAV